MKEIAGLLLDIGAVSLSPKAPFTWASGIKSPIYCDNRLVLSYPLERRQVEEALVRHVKGTYPQAQAILGTATAGIPHASIMAWEMGLPTGFIRSKAKDHGRGKQIEGDFKPGTKVVVVEDLLSTGGSSIAAAQAAQKAGLEVLGVVAIFSYGLPACEDNFREAGLAASSLTHYEELMDLALERDLIGQEDLDKLRAWRKDPKDPSWMDQ
ncbi:MAG: orotate phosphoribosyltransferase [Tissierellia bacterium]|nr:orotate phosphoribosyltransferase [Tissierellia bacterium]